MKRIIKQFLISSILVLSIFFSSSLFSQKSYQIYDLQEIFPEEYPESHAWTSFQVEDGFFVFGNYYKVNGGLVHTRIMYCLKINEDGEVLWMNNQGDVGEDYSIHAVLYDELNGYIAAGHHSDTITMPYNPMMAGFNTDGTPTWRMFHNWPEYWCEATDILPSDNGAYIAPIPGLLSETMHACLMKVDNLGNEIFKKPVFFGDTINPGFWITGTQTHNNEYIFTSEISTIGGQGSLVVFKTNDQLDTLWTKAYFGSYVSYPNDIIQTSDYNYIILCKAYNEITSSSDACLMKIDDSGEVLWRKFFGGEGTDRPKYLFEDDNGNLVFCGSTNSYTNEMQAWIVKADENGNELWNEVLDDGYRSSSQHICEYAPSKYIISGARDVEFSWSENHATITFLDKSPTSVNNTFGNNLSINLFPNPMTEKCTINYKLDKDAYVKIDLMNSQGYIIKNILSNQQQAGKQSIVFLNEGFDAGAYFLKFSINNDISMRKLMIMN